VSDIAFAHTLYIRLKPSHPSAVLFVHDGDGSHVRFGEDAQRVAQEMRGAKLETVQLDGQAGSVLMVSFSWTLKPRLAQHRHGAVRP
jgi:hypothetical protein